MPRPRNTKSPRPYGRQAKGKTIKSLSLDDEVAARAQKEADRRGMNFSEFVNGVLKGTITFSLLALLIYHITRVGAGPKAWTLGELTVTAKAARGHVCKLAR